MSGNLPRTTFAYLTLGLAAVSEAPVSSPIFGLQLMLLSWTAGADVALRGTTVALHSAMMSAVVGALLLPGVRWGLSEHYGVDLDWHFSDSLVRPVCVYATVAFMQRNGDRRVTIVVATTYTMSLFLCNWYQL